MPPASFKEHPGGHLANTPNFYQLAKEASALPRSQLGQWVTTPLHFHGGLISGDIKQGIVLFKDKLIFLPEQKAAYLYPPENETYKIPKNVFLLENNELQQISFPDANTKYSVLLFQRKNKYYALVLDEGLAQSLFVRLYFLHGEGLKYFKPVIERGDKEKYIGVFKITWSQ